jgi:hypothetical protein
MKMRLCLIGGVIILLVIIIGIPPDFRRLLTYSPHCGQEDIGQIDIVHFVDLWLFAFVGEVLEG